MGAVERLNALHRVSALLEKSAAGSGLDVSTLADSVIGRWGKPPPSPAPPALAAAPPSFNHGKHITDKWGPPASGPKGGSLRSRVLATLGGGAFLGLGLAGAAKGVGALEDVWERRGKGKAFSDMLAHSDDVRRLHTARPSEVKSHFDTLFRFNPDMAKDPLVASGFVKGTVGMGEISHKTVQDLISTRKSLRESATSPLHIPSLYSVE